MHKRPDCPACNNSAWFGTQPPRCICIADELKRLTAEEFMKEMNERYKKLEHHPEMHTHRINYLWKEVHRLSENENKILKGCDELDKRIEKLEKEQKLYLKPNDIYPDFGSYVESTVMMDSIDKRIEALEYERDVGVERIKKLEEQVKNITISNDQSLNDRISKIEDRLDLFQRDMGRKIENELKYLDTQQQIKYTVLSQRLGYLEKDKIEFEKQIKHLQTLTVANGREKFNDMYDLSLFIEKITKIEEKFNNLSDIFNCPETGFLKLSEQLLDLELLIKRKKEKENEND